MSGPMKLPMFFQRRFFPLWTATTLGAFTDNMLKQALIMALTFGMVTMPLIPRDDAVPILGALFPLAMALFSLLSGQVADKYEKSLLFRRLKLAEVGLMALAGYGFFTGNGLLLAVTLFLMGAQSAFFSPARISSMPQYLSREELLRGAGLFNGGLFTAILIGIGVGGWLVGEANGPALVFATLFGAALVGWLAVLATPAAAADSPGLKISWNPFAQALDMARFVASAPGVPHPIMGIGWFYVVGTALTVALALLVRDTFGGDHVVVAILSATFAIGAALGSIGTGLLTRGARGLGVSWAGAIVVGLVAIDQYFASEALGALRVEGCTADDTAACLGPAAFFARPESWRLVADFLLAAAASGMFVTPLQAAVQARAPEERRARIMAAGNIFNAVSAFVGSLSVLAITRTSLPPQALFLMIAVAQGGVAFYMWRRRAAIQASAAAAQPPQSDAAPDASPGA